MQLAAPHARALLAGLRLVDIASRDPELGCSARRVSDSRRDGRPRRFGVLPAPQPSKERRPVARRDSRRSIARMRAAAFAGACSRGRRRQAQMSAVDSSNQVTVRRPRRRQPHRAAMPATSCRPRPPSASRSAGRSRGAPGPPRSATSTRTTPPLALTATVTVPPSPTRCAARYCRTTRSPRPRSTDAQHRAPLHERAGDPRPLRPPAPQASQSPGPPAQPSAHPPSGPPPPGKSRGPPGRHTPDGRPTRRRASSPDTPPERAPEPRQAATHTAPWPRFPSAICPWTPQHADPQRYKVTHAGTQKNGPPCRIHAASRPFSQVVAGVGFEPT
jgi:hypothetical protein